MVNKDNDVGSGKKKPAARNAEVESLDVDQQPNENDLLRAIIDEWIVPALVEAYVRERTITDRLTANEDERGIPEPIAFESTGLIDHKKEVDEIIVDTRETG